MMSGVEPGPDTPDKFDQSPPHEEAGSSVVMHGVRAEWSGPLPPPALLRQFDGIVENGAERIFKQFEYEAEHRRYLESQYAKQEHREKLIAQGVAGLFAFTALGVAAYALSVGATGTAGVIGGSTIVMVVAAFLGTRLVKSGD